MGECLSGSDITQAQMNAQDYYPITQVLMTTDSQLAREIWVLTDGKAGMVAQAAGLAERVGAELGLPSREFVLRAGLPWRFLPAAFWPPGTMGISPRSPQPQPPWPVMTISCGRHGVGPALAIKQRSGGRTYAVHVQHPRAGLNRFDLIAAPRHDRLDRANVISTLGAVHRVTPEKLVREGAIWAERLAHLPHPRVAVIVGGANGVYRFGRAEAEALGLLLRRMTEQEGAGLMVTPSRRTGGEQIEALAQSLEGTGAYLWDMAGENPYPGILALADQILVTCDSVNMVSEACLTGKPVQVIDLPGSGTGKFDRLHDALRKEGLTRPFRGTLEQWSYTPLDETARVAARIVAEVGPRL